jgi:hypothetical protein
MEPMNKLCGKNSELVKLKRVVRLATIVVILLLFMYILWDDVSELRPPMGLFFISQILYE